METRGRSAKKAAPGTKQRSYADVVGKTTRSPKEKTPSSASKANKRPRSVSRSPAMPRASSIAPKALTATDVLLFYPNLIGYLRVLCMLLSFYYAHSDWQRAVGFYLAAFVGDVVDGYVARHFDQCSVFGGILDMITDRVSTAGFLTILSSLYPEYYFPIVLLIVLDIASHWMHVTSVSGHHKSKEVLLNRNALLQWYYSIYPLFGYCCVGAELFYILAYVLKFYNEPTIYKICVYGCLPACALKQVVNVVQLWSAMENIALVDAAGKTK